MKPFKTYNYFIIFITILICCISGKLKAQVETPPQPAEEFILPSSSMNIGIHANVSNYLVRGASSLNNIGFDPMLSFAYHFNLNKLVTQSVYVTGDFAFANNIKDEKTSRSQVDLGYRASVLLWPVGLISGVGYKTALYNMDAIDEDNYWLTQIYVPTEVYWTKLLPSKNAILIQAGLPLFELISASNATLSRISPNDPGSVLSEMNSDWFFGLPFIDYEAVKFAAAYVKTLSATTAIKFAYQMQYYRLYSPKYRNLENGIAFVYQF